MTAEQLFNFIESSYKQGLTENQIKEELKKAGWKEPDINLGFETYTNKETPKVVSGSAPPIGSAGQTSDIQFMFVPAESLPKEELPQKIFSKLFPIHILADILKGTQNFKPALAALILAIVLSIKPTYFLFSGWYSIVTNLPNKIVTFIEETYPQELEIKINNGVASTNVAEPYFITLPKETIENFIPINQSKRITRANVRLLTINTNSRPEDFELYQTYALLTQKELIYYNNNTVKTFSLKNAGNIVINKQAVIDKYNQINPDNKIGELLKIIIWLVPPLMVLFLFLGTLVSFFFFTLPVYILVKINKLSFSFNTLYKYAAATLLVSGLILGLVGLLPFVSNFLASFTSVGEVIALALAYSGIHYFKQYYESDH